MIVPNTYIYIYNMYVWNIKFMFQTTNQPIYWVVDNPQTIIINQQVATTTAFPMASWAPEHRWRWHPAKTTTASNTSCLKGYLGVQFQLIKRIYIYRYITIRSIVIGCYKFFPTYGLIFHFLPYDYKWWSAENLGKAHFGWKFTRVSVRFPSQSDIWRVGVKNHVENYRRVQWIVFERHGISNQRHFFGVWWRNIGTINLTMGLGPKKHGRPPNNSLDLYWDITNSSIEIVRE